MLDLASVRDWIRERYVDRGRPSIDSVVFVKPRLVMFFEGIRCERQSEQDDPRRRLAQVQGWPGAPNVGRGPVIFSGTWRARLCSGGAGKEALRDREAVGELLACGEARSAGRQRP